MAEKEHQRPEGRLLGDALRRSGMSARQAAPLAHISDTRLRHIINGYQPYQGQQLKVVGPADTVARIARVVGVTPDQLAAAGRPDAAAILRERETAPTTRGAELVRHRDEGREDLVAFLADYDPQKLPPASGLRLFDELQMLEELRHRIEDRRARFKESIRSMKQDAIRLRENEAPEDLDPIATREAAEILKRRAGDRVAERNAPPTEAEQGDMRDAR